MSRTPLALFLGLASAALVVAALEAGAAAGWVGWIALVPVLVPFLLFKDRYAPAGLAGLTFGVGLGGGVFRWLLADGRWVEWVTNVLSFALLGLIWSFLVWRYTKLPVPADHRPDVRRKKLEPLLANRPDVDLLSARTRVLDDDDLD